MRKVTEYFLGGASHWSDKVWFYGFYLTVTLIVAIVIFA